MNDAAADLTGTSKTTARTQESAFAGSWALYISVLLIAAVVAYGYWLHTRSIFACKATGYSADRYLAYCGGGNYGDYEHAAFQLDLEPQALDFARNADVLVLGNSRIQIALSTPSFADWFAKLPASYYLLGFSYNEDIVFDEKLLDKLQPKAKVFIINVDDFFDRRETVAAKAVLRDPDAAARFGWKRFSQKLHEPVCKTFPRLCGDRYVIFRSKQNGAYYRLTHPESGAATAQAADTGAVSYDQTVDKSVVDSGVADAIGFVKAFGKGRCVILTNVPYPRTNMGDAEAIAAGAGLPLVAPADIDGLRAPDGYHLDAASAEHWAASFLAAAGPEIRKCLADKGAGQT